MAEFDSYRLIGVILLLSLIISEGKASKMTAPPFLYQTLLKC